MYYYTEGGERIPATTLRGAARALGLLALPALVESDFSGDEPRPLPATLPADYPLVEIYATTTPLQWWEDPLTAPSRRYAAYPSLTRRLVRWLSRRA